MTADTLSRCTRRTPGATRRLAAVAAAVVALLLAACSKSPDKVDEARPVRVMVLSASNVGVQAEFSGEVRARFESRLGFQVGGKITARKVDVGTPVKRGQVLMQLDPQDVRLAEAQALANLRAAETGRDFAQAEMQRYQSLRTKNFVSDALIDAKVAAWKSAQASVAAARAAHAGQANQARYATLTADIDGVVTALDAEVGQVVAAGTPVVRVARLDDKEVVIGIPEDKVDVLRKVADVTVRLWAHPQVVIAGKIREVAPAADPATRTYQVKVAIPATAIEARLGMTALVRFASRTASPSITAPLTALHQDPSGTSVWLVENGAVRKVPVQLGGVSGNDVLLLSGVTAGQTVVTAGASLLKNGQKVTLLASLDAPGAAPVVAPASAGTAR